MSRILIIEDEQRIASFVQKGLAAAGLSAHWAPTGTEGLDLAMTGDFQLIVLDLGLPDMDGFDVLDALRGSGSLLPVIILTARTSLDATVKGLESGADDYLAKPFRFEELLARIRLRLRRPAEGEGAASRIVLGDITLDLHTRRVAVRDREVDLSAREFALVETFLLNPDQVLSREQLLSRVWGYDFDPGSNVVDVYVRYVRAKIGAERIETVRGMGYRFVTAAQ